MPPTTLIDQTLLNQTCQAAANADRQRKNANFHPNDAFPAHRLINAMQPGSYVRPHRHNDPNKDESIVVLQGRFGYLSFDDQGAVREAFILSPDGPVFGIDIPHGTTHTLLALESNSVFFEAKAGPFVPLSSDEIATWSPAEGTPEAAQLWQTWRTHFD
ncbi:MAG: WbuC family cupin fold metalloprotein [Fluviibacter sp.]|jgi:cupin fold WbuC family metalloprotein